MTYSVSSGTLNSTVSYFYREILIIRDKDKDMGFHRQGSMARAPPLPSPESIKSLAPYRHVKVEKEKCMRTVGRSVRVGVLEDRAGSFLPAS